MVMHVVVCPAATAAALSMERACGAVSSTPKRWLAALVMVKQQRAQTIASADQIRSQ
jgi:hypothetical protein